MSDGVYRKWQWAICLVAMFAMNLGASSSEHTVTTVVKNNAPLTLSAALSEAKENSHELQELKSLSDAASWKRLEFLSTYIPHISVTGTHYLSAQYQFISVLFTGGAFHFPTAFPQDFVSLDATWTVFDGFTGWHLYRSASKKRDAATQRFLQANFELEQAVRSAFYQTLAAEEMVKVTRQNVATLQDHLSIANAMLKTGVSTRFDVLRLEAQLEEANAEYLLAVDDASVSRDNLAKVMGISKIDARNVEGELPVPSKQNLPDNLTFSVDARHDLKAQMDQDESAQYQSKASFAFWVPNVSLFAQELFYKFGSFYPSVILNNSSFQNAYFVGVRVNWNIFDGGRSLAQNLSDAAQAKAAEESYRKSLIPLPFDFAKWKKRYLYYVILYKARIRTVEKAKESVRLAKVGLRAGVRTHTEVLDAETDWFRSNAQVIQAQVEAVQAKIALEKTLGRHL